MSPSLEDARFLPLFLTTVLTALLVAATATPAQGYASPQDERRSRAVADTIPNQTSSTRVIPGSMQADHLLYVTGGRETAEHSAFVPPTSLTGWSTGGGYTLMLTEQEHPDLSLLLSLDVTRFRASTATPNTVRSTYAFRYGICDEFCTYTVEDGEMQATLLGTDIRLRYRILPGAVRPFLEVGLHAQYPLAYSGSFEGSVTTSSTTNLTFDADPWNRIQPGIVVGAGVEWYDVALRVTSVRRTGNLQSGKMPDVDGFRLSLSYAF